MSYPYSYEQRCQVSRQRETITEQKLTIKRLEKTIKKLEKKSPTKQDLIDVLLIMDDNIDAAKDWVTFLIKRMK